MTIFRVASNLSRPMPQKGPVRFSEHLVSITTSHPWKLILQKLLSVIHMGARDIKNGLSTHKTIKPIISAFIREKAPKGPLSDDTKRPFFSEIRPA